MEHQELYQAEMDVTKKRIVNYWTKRSHAFSELRQREQKAEIGQDWMNEILPNLPEGKVCKILDVGCGTGFFALMLAEHGHEAIGIDLTEHMILHAQEIAEYQGSKAQFLVMDAEQPEFPDETFDMVVTRNLTWTLPHVEKAYKEWMRVLKKGGVLLNFDADYGHDPAEKAQSQLPPEHAHRHLSKEMNQECDAIKETLSISKEVRPAWDVEFFKSLGYENVTADLKVYRRIYKKIDEFFNPTPIFMLKVIKNHV